MKSRKSLNASNQETVIQSNRRKTIDTSIMNSSLDKENNKNHNNKRRYSIRSPASLKKDVRNNDETYNNLSDFDFSMINNDRRITANPADLSELLEDLVNQSCLSIQSEDEIESNKNQESIFTENQLVSNNVRATTVAIQRRKTFDGVITSSLIAEIDGLNDSSTDCQQVGFRVQPDRRATVDPSDLLSMMRDLENESDASPLSIKINTLSDNTVTDSFDHDLITVDEFKSPIHKKTKASPSSNKSIRSSDRIKANCSNLYQSPASSIQQEVHIKSAQKNSSQKKNKSNNQSPASHLRRSPRLLQSSNTKEQLIEEEDALVLDNYSDINESVNDFSEHQSLSVSMRRRTTIDANDLQDLLDDLDTNSSEAGDITTTSLLLATRTVHNDDDADDEQRNLSVSSHSDNSINTLDLMHNVSVMLGTNTSMNDDVTSSSSVNESVVDNLSFVSSNSSKKSSKKQNKSTKKTKSLNSSLSNNDVSLSNNNVSVSINNDMSGIQNRRETVDPSDFEAMMNDLNSSVASTSSANSCRRESSVSNAGQYIEENDSNHTTTDFSKFTGRESIETVVLLQSVANTLHALDESSMNHSKTDESSLCLDNADKSFNEDNFSVVSNNKFTVKPRRETVDQADLALLTQDLEGEDEEAAQAVIVIEEVSTDENKVNELLVHDDTNSTAAAANLNDDNATVNPADILNDTISTNNSMTTIGTLDLLDYVQATLEQSLDETSDTESELTAASLVPLADILTMCEREQQQAIVESSTVVLVTDSANKSVLSTSTSVERKVSSKVFKNKKLSKSEEKSRNQTQHLSQRRVSAAASLTSSLKTTNTRSKGSMKPIADSRTSLAAVPPSMISLSHRKNINNSTLKSCLSSRKQRPSISSQLSVSVEYEPTSTRKSVMFGSPQAAEFNKTSPTTNYTPLDKDRAKSMFSMMANIDIVPTTSNEDDIVDPVTAENDKILEEWDRLTNASDYGSSDDESIDSSVAATTNCNVVVEEESSPIVSLNSSSKNSRRRKSMFQPVLEIDDSNQDINSSTSPSSTTHMIQEIETSKTYTGITEGDSCSDITNTVNLPSNLADLINQNDNEMYSHNARFINHSKIMNQSMQSNSRTEEIEVDLQALMRNISNSHVPSSDFISNNSEDSALNNSDLSYVGPKYHSSQQDVSMDSTHSHPDALGSLIECIKDIDTQVPTMPTSTEQAHRDDNVDAASMQSSKSSKSSKKSKNKSNKQQTTPIVAPVVDIEDVTYNLEGSLSALMNQIGESPTLISLKEVEGNNTNEISMIDRSIDVINTLVDDELEFSSIATPANNSNPSNNFTSTIGSTMRSSPVDTISSDTLGEFNAGRASEAFAAATISTAPSSQLMSRLRLLNAGSRTNTLLQCGTPAVNGPGISSRKSIGFKRMSLVNETVQQSAALNDSTIQQSAFKSAKKRLSMMNTSFVIQSALKSTKKRRGNPTTTVDLSPKVLDRSTIIVQNDIPVESKDVDASSVREELEVSIPLSDIIEDPQNCSTSSNTTEHEEIFHAMCIKLTNYFSAIQSIKTVISQYRPEVQVIVRNSLSSNLHSAYVDSILKKVSEELLMIAWDLNPIDCEIFLERIFDGLPDNFYDQSTEIITNDRNDVEQMWINMSSVTIIAQTSVLNIRNNESNLNELQTNTTTNNNNNASSNTDRFFEKVLNKTNSSMNKSMKLLNDKYQLCDALKTNNLSMLSVNKHIENALEMETKLHTSTLLIDIINQLTYCRIVSFQSTYIKVLVALSMNIDISMIINFSKHINGSNNQSVVLLIDGIECDLIIAKSNKKNGIKHNDKENANVMKYFAEVICSDAKNGPLSAKSLENLENPSEIPALLYKISGKVSSLRLQLCDKN